MTVSWKSLLLNISLVLNLKSKFLVLNFSLCVFCGKLWGGVWDIREKNCGGISNTLGYDM